MDIQKILTKAKQQVLNEMEIFRTNIQQLYTLEEFQKLYNCSQDEFIHDVTLKALAIKQQVIDPQDKKYLWIGINPPPDTVTFKSLYDKTIVATNKFKWLKDHAFTIEANTDNGYRPHVHMMIPKTVKPNRVIKLLSSYYKVETNSIECKAGYCYNEHLKYILGEKKNEKKINVEKDIVERKELDIPDYILSTIYNGETIQTQACTTQEVATQDKSVSDDDEECSS